jgi:hypothetical protein
MVLPASGQLSLLDIQGEFGGSAPISLSEYYGAAPGVPGSGQISISDFYGKANTYSVEYLLVAGGGTNVYTGYNPWIGGGGAGGTIDSTATLTPGSNYGVTIGAGGTNGQAQAPSSSVFGITATGGGLGCNQGGGNNSGGSGGGGIGSGAAGISGQGNPGGAGGGNSVGGGGGGKVNAASGINGGNGINWKSLGTFYAGGGGGSGRSTPGTGGSGGGQPGNPSGGSGRAAPPNTGGGGSGAENHPNTSLGTGGSGIVRLRYSGPQRGNGGSVVNTGGYTYHTFNSSGTYSA